MTKKQDPHNKTNPVVQHEKLVFHSDSDVRLPDDLEFICGYSYIDQIMDIDEGVFIRRIDSRDELWTAQSFEPVQPGDILYKHFSSSIQSHPDRQCLEFSVPTQGDPEEAAYRMLEIMFRSNVGFKWPTRFLAPGLVQEERFFELIRGLEAELDKLAAAAREKESPIIATARELGLHPEPTGTGEHHWQATCPGTNHMLMIGTSSDTFGCGYCRKKGGPAELREFVAERRETLASIKSERKPLW